LIELNATTFNKKSHKTIKMQPKIYINYKKYRL